MKKITALALILLLVLSGCRLISDSDIYSDYAEVSVVSDGAAVSGAGGSAAESADSSASSENKNSSEYIISPADESKTEITVSVYEDEKVVPANGTGEIVNPVTPPPSDAEHDITVLPDFEEETTSELADTDSYNTDHTAVNQQDYYQYSQMTGKEKQIYGLLKSAVISCKNLVNVSGIGITTDDAVLAIYRFRADYPQYFWLSHSFAFTYNSYTDTVSSIYLLYTDGTSADTLEESYGNTYRVNINADRQKIVQRQKEVIARIESIISGIDADWSDYRKEKYIHDYVAANMIYDNDAAAEPYLSGDILKPAFDIYGAFINKTGVCEAYAKMFQVLCYSVGINANQVTGVGHMWNVVRLDGEWYQVDVTWDDSGVSSPMHSGIRYNYFNLPAVLMGKDGSHTPDGTLYVPDCVSYKYFFGLDS